MIKTYTKISLVMFMLVVTADRAMAQCNSWLNLSSPGTTASGSVNYVTTDQDNNVYYTGIFIDSISFGSTTLVNPTGGASFYVNKYNSDGVIQWAIQFALSDNASYSFAPVITCKNGKLYVAGAFTYSLKINSSTTLTPPTGDWDLFVLQLNLNGNITSYNQFYSSSESTVNVLGIKVNSLNQVYLAGRASGNLTFGSHVFNSAASFGRYAYLAKLDASNNPLWAVQSSITGIAYCRAWGIALDNNENVIIGGYCNPDITFGTQTFAANNSSGGLNPYIAKFDTAGVCQWIRGGQGPQAFSAVYTVASDNAGNVYFAGTLDSALTIDGHTLYSRGGFFYYCKYTSAGTLAWVKQTGDTVTVNEGLESPNSLVIDASNNMWMSGWTSPAMFGSYTISEVGVFIVKMDLDGNITQAKNGKGLGACYSSALDGNGNLYIPGWAYADTISFDGHVTINTNDTNGVDFLLKYCTSEAGIKEPNAHALDITIFPNPANSFLTIDAAALHMDEMMTVSVMNVLGAIIQEEEVKWSAGIQMNITNFQPGIYFLHLKTESGAVVKKFVKE